MTPEQSIEILRSLIMTSLAVVAPLLAATLVVGVLVSLLQSVTSVQEQTLSFVPKLIVTGLMMIFCAPWILRTLMQFAISFFARLPEMVR